GGGVRRGAPLRGGRPRRGSVPFDPVRSAPPGPVPGRCAVRAEVTVIGLDGGVLGEEARAALGRARFAAGAARHLDAVAPYLPAGAEPRTLGALGPVLDEPAEWDGPAVVLA